MKRTRLARRTPLRTRTRLRPVSAARRKLNAQRRQILETLAAERGPWCQARTEGVCDGKWLDGHELTRRSQGGSIVDRDGPRLVCRTCHDWIGSHPAEAVKRGLARWGMRNTA